MPENRNSPKLPEPASTEPNNPFGIAPALWNRIQKLRLMDDLLMRVALDGNIPAVQLILRIVLSKPELIVTELFVQSDVKMLISRGVRLDVKATDAHGGRYNIEIQRSDSGAHPKRARYHAALMDATFLKEGEDTDALTELWIIFITEQDYFRSGLPLYFIERTLTNVGNIPFQDDSHIVYVNGAYVGDDELGRLMSDFRTAEPERMHFKVLAESVRKAKSQEKGASKMSRVLEEMEQEGFERGYDQGFGRGYDQGYDQGYGKGFGQGKEQGAEEKEFDLVENLMKNLGFTLEQAMKSLNVSLSKKPSFEAKMQGLPT